MSLHPDQRQALYLIADEMRNMATLEKRYAVDSYIAERAERMMDLAIHLAALAEDTRPQPALEQVRAIFEAEPWQRYSPAIGVEAAVFNPHGEILLIQRADCGAWALPGGLAEVGRTLPESALLELWEEAGLRGEVERILGIFDGRLWGSRTKVHFTVVIFQVACADLKPQPGIEALAARFFPLDALPPNLYWGHDQRVPRCFSQRNHAAYFDPSQSQTVAMPLHQRRRLINGAAFPPPSDAETGANNGVGWDDLPPSLLHLLTRS